MFVTPMAAQVVKRLPEGDDWTYELKFDGYRALIIKDKQRVELRSRKNKDLTGMYPGIAAAGSRLNADQGVVDGELVALDAQGSPSWVYRQTNAVPVYALDSMTEFCSVLAPFVAAFESAMVRLTLGK